MSNRKKQAQIAVKPKKISGWDDAIADAKQRLKEIQFALNVFIERKRSGEPWPVCPINTDFAQQTGAKGPLLGKATSMAKLSMFSGVTRMVYLTGFSARSNAPVPVLVIPGF